MKPPETCHSGVKRTLDLTRVDRRHPCTAGVIIPLASSGGALQAIAETSVRCGGHQACVAWKCRAACMLDILGSSAARVKHRDASHRSAWNIHAWRQGLSRSDRSSESDLLSHGAIADVR